MNRKIQFLLSFHLFLLDYCAANSSSNITLSRPLLQGQTISSPDQVFELGYFAPNNSNNQYIGIWYKDISPLTVVWVANREKPVRNSPASLRIEEDGNLRLVDGKQDIIWSTEIDRVISNGSVAVLLNNGDFILMDSASKESLWNSRDHPSDTNLPGTLTVSNTKTGVLTSWKSGSDPSPGAFRVGFKLESPPQAILWKGLTPYWRSGPWDKSKFIGVRNMGGTYLSNLMLADNTEQGTISITFRNIDGCNFSNMFMSSSGQFKFMCYDKGRGWYPYSQVPNSRCEIYGACGPFGVCKTSEPLTCSCLKGFVPKISEEWSKQNWTRGCKRRTKLSCERNSTATIAADQKERVDGFFKIGGIKLPDFYLYVKVRNADTGCRQWCLNNCSCVAYAHVTGIGCLVWGSDLIDMLEFSSGGQDLFLRLTASELGEEKPVTLIASITTLSSFIILSTIAYGLYRWRAYQRVNQRDSRNPAKHQLWRKHIAEQGPLEPFTYYFDSILAATNNFSSTNKLGQGGYGPVYKGKLQDGKEVAIKRLSSSSGQGVEEFKTEIKLISKLQHINLVRLLGCCIEREENILIYEYMPNKSLDTYLFDSTKSTLLDWPKRFNIILGIARGILYLHRDSCLRIIHRDLKASNILLDEKMNPKISDFGLARIFQGTQDLANTHRVVGTLGYMSPEYALSGIFSEKSDTFSFGVLLLEIISGKKINSFIYNEEYLGLLAYAWQSWNEGRGLSMVDEALAGSFCSSEATRCVNIGLLCVQDKAADRPTMRAVVSMLSGDQTKLPQPKQPTFLFQNALNCHAESENRCAQSINQMSESIMEGR